MKDILEKISSYNLFNYLLPGILFVVMLDEFTTYSLIRDDLIVGIFIYYFVGLVISRFGSLIVEPILKRVSFVKFADYKDFVSASKKDPKIEILSEANNMYRTFISMFVLLVLLHLYELLTVKFPNLSTWNIHILVVTLMAIFFFSFRKQTKYITNRVEANMD